jgi:hypothetical protein
MPAATLQNNIQRGADEQMKQDTFITFLSMNVRLKKTFLEI